MTNCTGTPAEQFLERYIQGTLSPLEQQEFEEHYFDCPTCLAQLEVLQAVKSELALHPIEPPKTPVWWPTGLGALGAIGALAAMVVVGFFCYHAFMHRPGESGTTGTNSVSPQIPKVSQPASSTPSTPSVSLLADLALPPFQASSLRGTSEDSVFDAGMKDYANSDCRKAISILSSAKAAASNALAVRFYIGVCQMHEKNFSAAEFSLDGVADAGDSPQQEAALYYLAQIALARSDDATAHHYLDRTIALHGDFQRRAQMEIAKISVPVVH